VEGQHRGSAEDTTLIQLSHAQNYQRKISTIIITDIPFRRIENT